MDFIELIRIGSLKTIDHVIESKGLPDDNKYLDYKALNVALQFGRLEVAKYLLDKGCRVNEHLHFPDPSDTPLHHAVRLNDAELIDSLLRKGASVVAVNGEGNTPLHLAFESENRAVVDRLLADVKATSNYTDVENKRGLTHLHVACTRGNEEVAREYLENGASVDDTKIGAYGFQLSATDERESESADDDDPIEAAVMLAEVCKVADDFYDEHCYERAWEFHEACLSRSNTAMIDRFIAHETSVNTHIRSDATDYPGYTPLHFAVESGSVENVRLLLRRGAQVDRMNCAQMTPLHLALYDEDDAGKSAIVEVLYRALKDKTQIAEDENLLSFFHLAITRNKTRLVEEFLDDGEDVNRRVMTKTPNFPGYAPLHFAVRYGLQAMAMYLIRRGANMNQMSGHGSPLDIASKVGHEGLVRLLRANRVGA